MPVQRRRQRIASPAMLPAKVDQVPVERAVVDQFLDDELNEILHVRIGALLDECQLIDDRFRGGEPSQAQPRGEHL